jgi:[phosphatase 2A protein]-leucine-carboxy methyltransferase
MDFPENTTRKAVAIRKSRELSSLLGKPEDSKLGMAAIVPCEFCIECFVENGGTALHSPVYHLLPADLRLSPTQTMGVLVETSASDGSIILSPELPTLLIFECVLVYMTPASSTAVLQWFVDYFASSQIPGVLGSVVYEMFGLSDAFGKVMLNNLKVSRW